MTTEPAPDLTAVPWRQGRKNPRNMYAVTGDDWEAHLDIGKLDTAELAEEACRAHNAEDRALRLAAEWEADAAELDRDIESARNSEYTSAHEQARIDREIARTLRECATALRG